VVQEAANAALVVITVERRISRQRSCFESCPQFGVDKPDTASTIASILTI
jgi:hypothetical protein